jgi:S-adenosylmethionine:tRNA ribosyltransferase-isomerase
MTDRRFADLAELLDEADLLVVNRSQVSAVRLRGRKAGTGGRVEVLLLRSLGDGSWEALVRPAKRLREGTRIEIGPAVALVTSPPVDGVATLVAESGSLDEAIAGVGQMPLPPYFRGSLEDPGRYQTVYADRPGSAAAPTAGLHFTLDLLERLRDKGVGMAAIDLRVGLDTFRPISSDTVGEHVIHSEDVDVDAAVVDAVSRCRDRGGRVVAVGTTVVRALESAATPDGDLRPVRGPTRLFITPGHRFAAVDLLVTNFHVPGSTLVVLVAAFMGDRWRETYEVALERRYRFLSFGDAMLAERAVE